MGELAAGMTQVAMSKLMMMTLAIVLLLTMSSVTLVAAKTQPPLKVNFYSKTCPNAEQIVFTEMKKMFDMPFPFGSPEDQPHFGPNVAPDILRLFFHDCFVSGCDASVLLDGPTSEKTAAPNARLEGFDMVDTIKGALEAACPGIVSCADLLAFAARDAVRLAGGTRFSVPSGRRDGRTSVAALAVKNLPDPLMSVDKLTKIFANQGMSRDEMVILSGAHSIGDAACHFIDNRLYNFPKTGVDPSLPPAFAAQLKAVCTAPGLKIVTTLMDQVTPGTLDTQYYKNLKVGKSVLSSDQVLFDDKRTRPLVNKMAAGSNAVFLDAFNAAMVKLGKIRTLRGTDGEVRLNCRVVNGAVRAKSV